MAGMPGDVVIEEFRSRWESLTGQFWDLRGSNIQEGLRQALETMGSGTPGPILIWEAPWFREWDTPEWLRGWGYDPIVVRPDPAGPVDEDGNPWERRQLKEAAATAEIGLSAGSWAVSHTGSVAFYGDRQHGTWPSLLPPAHLILLSASTVYATLGEGLARLAARAGGIPPQVKLVTGPSSTGDIEGQSVIGVHGPARVGIVLVEPQGV
ncbi:MAG: LutC/YkgG family protein [Clostridia bacterium]